MDPTIANLYQYATIVSAKASMFFNVKRPRATRWLDPTNNVSFRSVSQNSVGTELANQLQSAATTPTLLGLVFAKPLPSVLTGPDSFENVVFPAATLPFKLIKDLIGRRDPIHEILSLPQELMSLLSNLLSHAPLLNLPLILVNQIEVALSVLPTLQMFNKFPAALKRIDEAFTSYWFGDGFKTIGGEVISRSTNKPTSSGDTETLRSLIPPRSGADEVRNAVRITIEAGGDVEYELDNRIIGAAGKVFGANPTSIQKEKLVNWMVDFAAQADAAATSAVETLVLGAGPAQTNTLIGAAAGTAAGTAARKAVEHVYLSELGA